MCDVLPLMKPSMNPNEQFTAILIYFVISALLNVSVPNKYKKTIK